MAPLSQSFIRFALRSAIFKMHVLQLSPLTPMLKFKGYTFGAGVRFSETATLEWKPIYPPYLQTVVFFFQIFLFSIFDDFFSSSLTWNPMGGFFRFFFQFLTIFFSSSLSWDPMGGKVSKRYFFHSFHSISTKLYDKYVGYGGIQAITFLAICPNFFFFKYGILKLFGTQYRTIWSWKFQSAISPTVFMGCMRAAFPWRTLGIRSCRTFCSDLALIANCSHTVQWDCSDLN